jgi:hypothetical protein
MVASIILLAAPCLALLLWAVLALSNRRAKVSGAQLAAASAAHRNIKRRQLLNADPERT